MSHATFAPALIIVSGAPGTGKTTLGRRIAGSLGIPYIGKDLIKESLFDSLGTRDREWSMRLGVASIELLFKLIESHLMLGQSLVAESNFRVQYDIPGSKASPRDTPSNRLRYTAPLRGRSYTADWSDATSPASGMPVTRPRGCSMRSTAWSTTERLAR